MHWSILTRYLMALLVITSISEINGEKRVKRDLQVITDILRTKMDLIRNLSNNVLSKPLPPVVIKEPTLSPELIQTHAKVGFQAIPCKNDPIEVSHHEIKPVSNTGNYYYKQMRDDGSAMIYTSNGDGGVDVTDTRYTVPIDELKDMPYRTKYLYSQFQNEGVSNTGSYYYKQMRDDGSAMIYTSNGDGGVDVTDTRYTVPIDELKTMPYRTKYLYSQFQNEGDNSGVVYTLDNRGQVQISYIRDIPLNTGNNDVQRSANIYQSDVRTVVTPYQSFNQYERPVYRQFAQSAKVIPDYSYKMVHRDGSVTTYLGTGEVKEQKLRSKPVPDPPAYLVNRIQNVAANTLCVDRPSNVLCKLNPVWFRYQNDPYMQAGMRPIATPMIYTYGDSSYNTLPAEVKEVPKNYIFVPPVEDVPQPVTSDVKKEEKKQIPIDDVKTSVEKSNAQAKKDESASQGSTYIYKQVNSAGADMTVLGKGKDSVSVSFKDGGSPPRRSDRGDIPEGRSF